jgi:hypothetical protein
MSPVLCNPGHSRRYISLYSFLFPFLFIRLFRVVLYSSIPFPSLYYLEDTIDTKTQRPTTVCLSIVRRLRGLISSKTGVQTVPSSTKCARNGVQVRPWPRP